MSIRLASAQGHRSSFNSSENTRNFDFSALHQSMADIKRNLWEINRRSTSMQKRLTMHHSYFANKVVVKKKDDAFNSYSNTEVSLSHHLTAKSTSREKYHIPERKDVPIASNGLKSNTRNIMMSQNVSKRKNL